MYPATDQPRLAPEFAGDLVLAEMVRRLVEALHPQCIYLFGSRARGDNKDDSDYDVLLIIDAERNCLHKLSVVGRNVLSDIRASIDVLVMTPHYFASRSKVCTSLPATVLAEGSLVYAA